MHEAFAILRIESLARDLVEDFVPNLNMVVLPSEDGEALCQKM